MATKPGNRPPIRSLQPFGKPKDSLTIATFHVWEQKLYDTLPFELHLSGFKVTGFDGPTRKELELNHAKRFSLPIPQEKPGRKQRPACVLLRLLALLERTVNSVDQDVRQSVFEFLKADGELENWLKNILGSSLPFHLPTPREGNESWAYDLKESVQEGLYALGHGRTPERVDSDVKTYYKRALMAALAEHDPVDQFGTCGAILFDSQDGVVAIAKDDLKTVHASSLAMQHRLTTFDFS